MKYLVIDLEMCRVPEFYQKTVFRFSQETIQIGAVLLNEDYQQIATLSQYVHPRFGALDTFITNLTGIDNSNIKDAPLLEEALEHLIDWIGNQEYEIFAWSNSDRKQLLHEISEKHIESEKIDSFMDQDRWVDYQDEFMYMFGFRRNISLQEALRRAEIEVEGRLHDGLDDAINTSALIAKLETNPDFELADYAIATSASFSKSCTLGDLWPGKAS